MANSQYRWAAVVILILCLLALSSRSNINVPSFKLSESRNTPYTETQQNLPVPPPPLPNAKSVFSDVYKSHKWGGGDKPYSGAGSHDDTLVAPYVDSVRSWIQRTFSNKAPNVLDLGCGDFNVGSQIRNITGAYTAGDVVEDVITFNREAFADAKVDFKVIDLIEDDLPPADVIFIRQVLQHLTNAQIQQVVPKLGQYQWAVITEHVPSTDDFSPNADHTAGSTVRVVKGSGVDLSFAPFNLQYKSKKVICEVTWGAEAEKKGRVRTTAYEL